MRYPFIDQEIEEELFSYLGGICKSLECFPVIVGGYKDHIHILCILSRKIALMKLVEELKSRSSKWIKTKGLRYQKFYWQRGYGVFSVSERAVEIVKSYIKNQSQHHIKKTFKEEYSDFNSSNKIEFDERYIWD